MMSVASGREIGFTSRRTQLRLVSQLRAQGISDETVLTTIAQVPRHRFVEEALQSRAYEDTALPIGRQQTISQPYIVALMTQQLVNGRIDLGKVLEIGTGCGYQTAVLASLVNRVYTIERIGSLLETARQTLQNLGVYNVSYRHADGTNGWPGRAPFDSIIITAAPDTVPQGLLDQLGDGGRLVAPEGGRFGQHLTRVVRQGQRFRRETSTPVIFVPMLLGTEE